ncbi:MAG: hypothetical protein KatS3mg010_1309 [Acidimicrobiia bacterium]|nr:MAG: hypothetical protein KatS3mg010_1309 [Acidimicrobiia bacterium]
MASVSPRHDTHPLVAAAGWFSVSILAGDQVEQGQYFSYPGRRFRHIASEYLTEVDGVPVVDGCIAWLRCETFERKRMLDHELFFARVTHWGYGRLHGRPARLLGPARMADRRASAHASAACRCATASSSGSRPRASTTSGPATTRPTTRERSRRRAGATRARASRPDVG